jgi:hypothetical protein
MTKQSLIFCTAAVVAGIVAIYLWLELRDVRSQSMGRQDSSRSANPDPQPNRIGAQPESPVPPAIATIEAPLTPPAAQPPVLPGQEFDRILNDVRVARQHAAWQAESRDPEWAQAAEDYWHQRFAAKPEIGPPLIQCKTTLCEIRFLILGADKAKAEEILKRPIETQGSPTQGSVKDSTLTFFGWTLDEQDGSTAGVQFARYVRTKLPD